MEVVKEFVVKGYIDASFDTNRITMSSETDSYSRVDIWSISE